MSDTTEQRARELAITIASQAWKTDNRGHQVLTHFEIGVCAEIIKSALIAERERGIPEGWQLSDEGWRVIKLNADQINVEHVTFEGDWGNWNYLIYAILTADTQPPEAALKITVDHSTGTDKTMAVTREGNRITDVQDVRPLREIRKEFNQAWVWCLDKWILLSALDTVCMDAFCSRDKDDCPAIGIPTPPAKE